MFTEKRYKPLALGENRNLPAPRSTRLLTQLSSGFGLAMGSQRHSELGPGANL